MTDTHLTAAIAAARQDYEGPGIYAQRFADGTWTVSFAEYADFMTRISDDDDAQGMTDAAIAEMILDCWESDWTSPGSAPVLGDAAAGGWRHIGARVRA